MVHWSGLSGFCVRLLHGVHFPNHVEGNYYLKVAGIAINDNFQVLDEFGGYNSRIFMMAVPYVGGFNPDYSGLDFCEAASAGIVKTILKYRR